MIRAMLVVVAAGCSATAAEPTAPKLEGGGCEGPAPGAATYYVGEIAVTDGVISGTEQWVLFPNEKWRALGAKDCSLTWTLSGTVSAPAKCQGCDLGLRVHAEPDRASSTCPPELVHGRSAPTGQKVGGEANAFDERYDVRRTPDGKAAFHFGESGTKFADGWHAADRLGFTSNRQCKWF